MSRTTYYGFNAGDIVILNELGIHDGYHVDKGTEIKVSCFPPKVRKGDRTDKNKNGHIRDYFMCGDAVVNGKRVTVRTNLNKIVKKR